MAAAATTDTTVETVDATRGEAQNVALGGRTKRIRLPRATGTVVFERITGQTQGALLAVYANLPEGVQPNTEASTPYLVGNIAPFGIGEPVAHSHADTAFLFDIDDRHIGNAPELVLTIVPEPNFEPRNINVGQIRFRRR